MVNRRLRARFNVADWVAEQAHGIAQLFFLRTLAEAIETDWPSVGQKLEEVRRQLVNRSTMLANVTLDSEHWTTFQPQLESFWQAMPGAARKMEAWQPTVGSHFEGLTIPALVNYVGKGADLYRLGYRLHGSGLVIKNYLAATWMWERVRMRGGAYGGYCQFDIHSGVFTYLSYRDPNLLATLDNFDAAAAFLRELDVSEAELTKAIIGTIGDLDAYLLPDAKGWTSMTRHLLGYTDAQRQKIRDEVLGATAKDFKSFAEVLASVREQGEIVVLGSQAAIEKANAERNNLLEVKKVH